MPEKFNYDRVMTPAVIGGNAKQRKTNQYRIEGDYAFIRCPKGNEFIETKIDLADLELALAEAHWRCARVNNENWYIVGSSRYPVRPRVRLHLHRTITDAPEDKRLMVDHLNGNTLDNTRANLRVTTVRENNRNTWQQRLFACPHCRICDEHKDPFQKQREE